MLHLLVLKLKEKWIFKECYNGMFLNVYTCQEVSYSRSSYKRIHPFPMMSESNMNVSNLCLI